LSNAIQESEAVCDISTETIQLERSGKLCRRNENKSLVFTRYVDHLFNFRVSEKVNPGEAIFYVKGSQSHGVVMIPKISRVLTIGVSVGLIV
jgi:hypothetical protein